MEDFWAEWAVSLTNVAFQIWKPFSIIFIIYFWRWTKFVFFRCKLNSNVPPFDNLIVRHSINDFFSTFNFFYYSFKNRIIQSFCWLNNKLWWTALRLFVQLMNLSTKVNKIILNKTIFPIELFRHYIFAMDFYYARLRRWDWYEVSSPSINSF